MPFYGSIPANNPYKFAAWRSAAANTGSAAFAIISMDTEEYDTSNNHSSGVFTAPVTGFYWFTARASVSATTTRFILALYKNGGEVKRGHDFSIATANTAGGSVSALLNLAVNDTVDVRAFGATAVALEVGQTTVYFQGCLLSII